MGKYHVHRSDGNADEIIAALRRVGATVEPIGRPVDVIVGWKGRNYLLEIKTPRGRLRAGQERFLDEWRGQVAVVRSVDEALQSIQGSR